MPQFDPSSFASQFFWLVVMFVLLYLVVSRFAMPRLGDVLETRQRTLSNDVERAHGLKVEAEALMDAYVTASTAARAQAQNVLAQTRNAAQTEADDKNRAARLRLNEQIKNAEQRIAEARDAAIAEIGHTAGAVASQAVYHLAGVSVDPVSADAAVALAMKESS